MCTVTILPQPIDSAPLTNGDESLGSDSDPWLVRMLVNRDEQRTRVGALPPEIRVYGGRRGLLPIDPASRGSWVAANDAGLMFTLLNAYESAAEPGSLQAPRSRGEVIPALLAHDNLDRVVAAAGELTPTNYRPFRLLVASAREVHLLHSSGREWVGSSRQALTAPLMFTSSGLGDALVQPPRAELFERLFAAPAESVTDWAERQEGFHSHVWPERLHLSVLMSRDDACTVSQTTVELGACAVRMAYRPVETSAMTLSAAVERVLPLARPGHA